MHAATDRLEFAPPPTAGLTRALALAVLAHAVLLAALTWGVHWKRDAVTVTAEAELWSSVPQQAAPKLVDTPPEPPQATPPVAPQVQPRLPDADIALEREKLRLKKEKQQELEKLKQDKLNQEKLLLEKKRQQDKRDQERQAIEDKKKSELDSKRKEAAKAQQDTKQMEAQRQANIQRMAGLAGATGASTATGTARQSSGPSASYAGRIRASIKPNIVFADDTAGNPVAEVEVRTAPDGTIISRKLTKPSGVQSWDDAVLKAIDKTGKLPRDVDGRVPNALIISFRPKD
ncbi:cell envelope integrity protein TolA [Rhodoferax sp.]|uniref:cell envelope integrity protein TolA n=1 Tax=Rhodoferax sp. TaxID=50421 RepID=UPI002716198E|nr:cell envelope integrity protein TolA [Rhodoferax sp.]MDO9196970.1 cell envelope integrity protein TolA [Rhodoferax sp.]